MVAEKVLITIAYDAGKGLLDSILKDRDHEEAVSEAATTVASSTEGVAEDDLRDVFEYELDEDVLKSAKADELIPKLANALKYKANTVEDVDYEAVITQFLDQLEQNIVAQGRPEEGVQVLYEYARETNHLAEDLREEIRRLHREYHDDLTILSNRSSRVVPGEDQYRLPGIDKHIDQPVTSAIQDSIAERENVILTGPAGVGKSGILAELYHTWDEEQPIYFLDAREFGSIDSRRDIESELGLRNSITDVFSRIAENTADCVLVVDQLDNVRTERGVPNIFENLLLDLADIDSLTVVCACRDWDLNQHEYQGLQNADDFSRTEVEPLTDEQIEQTLAELGIEGATQNEALIELCQSLLNLSLLADVVAHDVDMDASTITEKITLWEEYRESLNKGGRKARGKIPRDWDESPVDRAVQHARSSLKDSTTTFRIDESVPGDQRLLSRNTIERDWRERCRFRHDQLQSYFYARDAAIDNLDIQVVLDDGLDELVAADVFEWMLQFYLERPSRSASFIRDALGSSSELGFYARTIIANTAQSLGPETLGEDVARAVIESLNTDGKLAREFYRELESPNWVNFLLTQELLSQTGFHAARYVDRLVETHPQVVVDAMQSYDSVEIQIAQTYLSNIHSLNGELLASAAQTAENWIQNLERDEIRRVGRDLTELITALVEDDQPETAIELVSLLIEPIDIETEEQEFGEYTHTQTTIESRFEPYTIQNFFDKQTEKLAEACGIQLLDQLEAHFQDCLRQLERTYNSDVSPEQALKRRTARVPYQVTDLELMLYQVSEDVLTFQFSNGVSEAIRKVEAYLEKGGIFAQLAIYVLGQTPSQKPDLVTELLTNWPDYKEEVTERDHIYLLKNGFEHLSDQNQQEVVNRIEDGPDEQEIREFLRSYKDLESEEAIDKAVKSRVERWKLKRFYYVRGELSKSKQEFVQGLIYQHGEVEYDLGSGYHIPYSSDDGEGEESASFENLNSNDFIGSCIEYSERYSQMEESEDEEEFLSGPRPNLSRELRERILSEPAEYIPKIPEIIETGDDLLAENTFSAIRFLITGNNYQDKSIENWNAIITAGNQFCSQSPFEESWSRDCRRAFANMMRILIGHVRSSLTTANYESELSNILLTLLGDADDGDYPGSIKNNTPRKTSVKGVRAVGVVTTIHFLRNSKKESFEISSEQQLWDRLQELLADDTGSVRAGFGKMLFSLFKIDDTFVSSNLDTLLPVNADSADVPLFVSAWKGYMINKDLAPDLFEILKSQYEHAITLHKDFDSETHDQTFENLCSHLAIAYTRSEISYDDDLVQSVFTVSVDELNLENPASADNHFAETFADLLSNTNDRELEEQCWERAIEFWQKRLDDTSSNNREGFTQYTRILYHPPQSASLGELSEQLKQSAPSIASSPASTRVMGFLAEEVNSTTQSNLLNDAVVILDEFIEHADSRYPLRASDERWTVVKAAAENGNELALEVAQKFFELGEPEYKKIIEKHKKK